MHRYLKVILRFILCTAIVFGISYGTMQVAMAYEEGKIAIKPMGSLATGIFMLLNFPLWIMGKGDKIFHLDWSVVRVALLGDAAFYGMILTAWFTNIFRKPLPPQRRSLE